MKEGFVRVVWAVCDFVGSCGYGVEIRVDRLCGECDKSWVPSLRLFRGHGRCCACLLARGSFRSVVIVNCGFPAGVVSIFVSDTHVGCQVILSGMERMGVSSSSEFSRCAVVSPSILWWHNCLAARWSGLHLLTLYIVQWGRYLCASISIVSRGMAAVCCGLGRSLGMGGGGRFRVFLGVVNEAVIFGVGVLVSVA